MLTAEATGNLERWAGSLPEHAPITVIYRFRLNADIAFLLEFDDERSGGFEPLAQVPEDRTVVVGLISSKKPELENKAELIQRLEMAALYKGKDRLALSPQCGFASTMEGNLLTEADQEAKLCLVSAVAKEIWD